MRVIVAGNITLDLVPALPADEAGFRYKPGTVVRTGPSRIAPGGCVTNTGAALHRLGVPVRLLAKIGDDAFGQIVRGMVENTGECSLITAPGEQTSHSFVLSPPGHDRMILNHPGANNTFTVADIPAEALEGASMLHFGYPPAMRSMFEDNGRNLVALMQHVKGAGLVTSLDMSYPDPASPGGKADWRTILQATLPHVDFYMPSLAEAVLVMEPEKANDPAMQDASAEYISYLGKRYLEWGAALVAIKLGERGIYLRTASREKLSEIAAKLKLDIDLWSNRELWANTFQVEVAGTVGAGDATAAGLLLGLYRGMSPDAMLRAACAVGASRVETADAAQAIKHWERIEERINAGWERKLIQPGESWQSSPETGIWKGPADAVS